jgi:hypothetical protein
MKAILQIFENRIVKITPFKKTNMKDDPLTIEMLLDQIMDLNIQIAAIQ